MVENNNPIMKYVLVTGGVVSGLGKGVTASSIGVLLQNCGHRVTHVKIDPYLNIDAGTMSPFEHGEVFVLDDGGEVDLDLGNYERFLDITLTKDNNITTGKIYQNVINKERQGDYLGRTVQVVPHITDEIQSWIERVAQVPCDGSGLAPDVCVIELGGVVGDIESAPFIEALRQMQFKVGKPNFCIVHVSLVPLIGVVGEQKTKPTQHSVQVLRSLGLNCDLLVVRTSDELEPGAKEKLSIFCHVPPEHVLNIADVPNIWWVPVMLREQKAHVTISGVLGLSNAHQLDISAWETRLASRADTLAGMDKTNIAIIGKYTGLSDAYQSVVKALLHASVAANLHLNILWVEAENLLQPLPNSGEESRAKHIDAWDRLKAADGVLVPGGFGVRGVEGKVVAAKYAREHRVPFLGVCLGMQVAVIEFARHVLGMEDAHSEEFQPKCKNPVVVFMPEGSRTHKGGTMRCGSRDTILQTPDCMAAKLYQKSGTISERHRHRYEVNPAMVQQLQEAGLRFVGTDETGTRMEIVELGNPPANHPFYFGTQFHPEFKSRPLKPSPPYLGFMLASGNKLHAYLGLGGKGNMPRSSTVGSTENMLDGHSPIIGLSTGGQSPHISPAPSKQDWAESAQKPTSARQLGL